MTKDQSPGSEPTIRGDAPIHDDGLWEFFLQRAPVLMWTTDRQLRFVRSAGAALASMGLEPNQLAGMSLYEFFGTDKRSFIPIAAHIDALEGRFTHYEQNWAGRSFRATVGPLLNREGESLGAVGFAIEISDLLSLGRRDNHLPRGDQQRLEAVGRVASSIAQDVSNLLTGVMEYGQRLARELEGDPRQAGAQEIVAAGERASSLSRQILAFAGKPCHNPRILDLNELITGLEVALRELTGENGELILKLAAGLGHVHVDQGQVEQLLMRLVASTKSHEGVARAIIETSAVPEGENFGSQVAIPGKGPSVMLTVRDVRGGANPDLATIFGLAEDNGGQVLVESEPGRGTVVKVLLPQVETASTLPSSSFGAVEQLGGKETILLVDDEPALRMLAHQALREYGYRVLEASDVEDALRIGESYAGRIDLLLTDVVMPGMSGPQVAARMAPLRPEMKILYMSGYADDAIVRRGVVSAGQALLLKPFTLLGLAHEVRKILRSTSS